MPGPGQPRALDDEKQKTVCSLVAAGVSLRQAAYFVDCDPKSIRREAQRNDDFRRQLAQAKSAANIHPLQTLHQAAKADWRAALSWMERIDPDRFSRPDAAIITKREANQFVADLVEAIERAISNPQERKDLFELLAPALPAAMRRRWNGRAVRRALEQITREFDQNKKAEFQLEQAKKRERDLRRHKLFVEIGRHLPDDLYQKLGRNGDLLDPEEVFAERPHPVAVQTPAPAESHDHDPKHSDTTNNASPATNNVPLPGPNPPNIAPLPSSNPKPHNDLPTPSEAISHE